MKILYHKDTIEDKDIDTILYQIIKIMIKI